MYFKDRPEARYPLLYGPDGAELRMGAFFRLAVERLRGEGRLSFSPETYVKSITELEVGYSGPLRGNF